MKIMKCLYSVLIMYFENHNSNKVGGVRMITYFTAFRPFIGPIILFIFFSCGPKPQVAPTVDEEAVMEVVVVAGAEEVETALDGSTEVITTPELFDTVRAALAQQGLEPEIAQIVQRPATETELDGDDARKVVSLVDALEEMDDVQDVFTNASFPEEMAASG